MFNWFESNFLASELKSRFNIFLNALGVFHKADLSIQETRIMTHAKLLVDMELREGFFINMTISLGEDVFL